MFLIVDNHDRMCVDHLSEIMAQRGIRFVVLDRTAPLDAVDRAALRGVFLSGGDAALDVTQPLALQDIRLDAACLCNLEVPIFGICMGFEIIVALLGGKLDHISPPPDDCVEVSPLMRGGIFSGLPETICMMEFNSIHAISVPSDLSITARSARSPIEAVQHKRRHIVATQFHPEATDQQGQHSAAGLLIVNNFLDLCLSVPRGWW